MPPITLFSIALNLISIHWIIEVLVRDGVPRSPFVFSHGSDENQQQIRFFKFFADPKR
jgi:hypothetical protein